MEGLTAAVFAATLHFASSFIVLSPVPYGALTCVHSKVDAFAPHATVGVVYVETFLADHLRIAASCAVPQAVGC